MTWRSSYVREVFSGLTCVLIAWLAFVATDQTGPRPSAVVLIAIAFVVVGSAMTASTRSRPWIAHVVLIVASACIWATIVRESGPPKASYPFAATAGLFLGIGCFAAWRGASLLVALALNDRGHTQQQRRRP